MSLPPGRPLPVPHRDPPRPSRDLPVPPINPIAESLVAADLARQDMTMARQLPVPQTHVDSLQIFHLTDEETWPGTDEDYAATGEDAGSA